MIEDVKIHNPLRVIPAKAGIHFCPHISVGASMDSRLRGNDKSLIQRYEYANTE